MDAEYEQPPSVATDNRKLMGRIMSAFDFSDVLSVDEIRDIAANEVREYLTEQPRDGLAMQEATSLAVSLWQKHFQTTAPDWKPLNDLRGVISQIDNMTTALSRPDEATVERVARALFLHEGNRAELWDKSDTELGPAWAHEVRTKLRPKFMARATAALAALRTGAGS